MISSLHSYKYNDISLNYIKHMIYHLQYFISGNWNRDAFALDIKPFAFCFSGEYILIPLAEVEVLVIKEIKSIQDLRMFAGNNSKFSHSYVWVKILSKNSRSSLLLLNCVCILGWSLMIWSLKDSISSGWQQSQMLERACVLTLWFKRHQNEVTSILYANAITNTLS